MAAKKRNRQQMRAQQVAHARRAAELARRKKDRKGRLTLGALVAMIAVVGVLGLLLARGGAGSEATAPVTTAGSTATSEATQATPPPLPSAAGKPCLPVADALPPGAPSVPVRVGPPPTALVTQDLKEGTGAVVTADQTLTVNYIGVSCSTGKIFDSSYSRNQPATFPLSGVIPGWQQGIPGMKVGGQRLLGIPPAQGYGDEGGGSDIAPGETLWFVVEVLDAKAG